MSSTLESPDRVHPNQAAQAESIVKLLRQEKRNAHHQETDRPPRLGLAEHRRGSAGLRTNDASTDTGAAGVAASAAKPTKQQKKQARKEARAKKNAELKKLEDAGYQPGRANDSNYPQDLQDAQKKAGIGQGASQ